MTPSAKDVFELFVRDHVRMLRAFILSGVPDPAAADDLLQETLVAAWRKLDRFDRSKPVAPWLRGIAFREILDWRRFRARHRAVSCDEATLALLEERFARVDAVEADTWEGRTRALRDCLEGLEEEDRRIVALHYERNESCDRIAGTLGQGLEWVKKRLQRARARLGLCVDGVLAGEAPSGS